MTIGGPLTQLTSRAEHVGEVRLQHDAGIEVHELGFVEHAPEHRDGQVEVAVLLHVEVDELRRIEGCRHAVQLAKTLTDALDRVVEGERADAGADRRDLHRHVAHVVAPQACEHHVEPAARLGVADDRLAEHVQVAPHALLPTSGQVIGQLRVVGRKDHPCSFRPQAAKHQWHHESRRPWTEPRADREHHPVGPRERRQLGGRDQLLEPAGGATRDRDADDLVGESRREVGGFRIAHQHTETLATTAFATTAPGIDRHRLADEAARQLDRSVDPPLVIHAGGIRDVDGHGASTTCRASRPSCDS